MLLKQLEQGADIDIFNTIRRLRFRRERTVETHVRTEFYLEIFAWGIDVGNNYVAETNDIIIMRDA